MDPSFITILQQLIAEQGKEALFNPGKCKALLADYTRGEFKKESRLLLQALDAGVVKAIDTTQELEICKKQQVRLLHEDYFLTEEIAIDVVDTLAFIIRGEEQKQDNNICKKCGKELQDDWKTCPFCGMSFEMVVADVEVTVVKNTEQIESRVILEEPINYLDISEQERKTHSSNTLLIAVIITILISALPVILLTLLR